MYNINDNIWTAIKTNTDHQPLPRYGHSAVVYNDIMYVFGGYDNGGFSSNELYKFHLPSKQWIKSQRLDTIPERFHHAVCLDEAQGKMYISGGCDSSRFVFDQVYQVHLTSELVTCTKVANMPNARYGHVMYYNHAVQSLHIFGGCDFKGPSDFVDGYWMYPDHDEKLWEKVETKPFRNNTVFATVVFEPSIGEFLCGGVIRNEPKMEQPVVKKSDVKQTPRDELSVMELSAQLGDDVGFHILQFLQFSDILSVGMVNKRWHLSILANRKS
jgi:hypothetical protein